MRVRVAYTVKHPVQRWPPGRPRPGVVGVARGADAPAQRAAAGIRCWAPSQETHGHDGRCDLTQPVHGGFEMRLQLSARLPRRARRTARTLGPGGGHSGHAVQQVRPDPQGLRLRRVWDPGRPRGRCGHVGAGGPVHSWTSQRFEDVHTAEAGGLNARKFTNGNPSSCCTSCDPLPGRPCWDPLAPRDPQEDAFLAGLGVPWEGPRSHPESPGRQSRGSQVGTVLGTSRLCRPCPHGLWGHEGNGGTCRHMHVSPQVREMRSSGEPGPYRPLTPTGVRIVPRPLPCWPWPASQHGDDPVTPRPQCRDT